MISGESRKGVHNTGRRPCDVCGRGVGRNSIQCTKCQKWVHRKCSGIKGRMIKVSKIFVGTGCTDQQASMDRTSMDNWRWCIEVIERDCQKMEKVN